MGQGKKVEGRKAESLAQTDRPGGPHEESGESPGGWRGGPGAGDDRATLRRLLDPKGKDRRAGFILPVT